MAPAVVSLVTFTAHFMTSAVSSDTTRSTHLRLGSLSLRICFLTIASNARSGVKSPVLKGHGVSLHFVLVTERGERGGKKREKREKKTARKEKRGNKKRKKGFVKLIASSCSQKQAAEKDKPQVFTASFLRSYFHVNCVTEVDSM